MLDIMLRTNPKLVSDEELLNYKQYLQEKMKQYKKQLLKVNRIIKQRKLSEVEQMKYDIEFRVYDPLELLEK